jgi:hypothetical protein
MMNLYGRWYEFTWKRRAKNYEEQLTLIKGKEAEGQIIA